MLSVDCGPILLQLFSWESHETSTIPPSRIFPKGHSMICSCFLSQGWVNLLTNSKLGGFKGCFAFHNVGFMVKGSTVVGLKQKYSFDTETYYLYYWYAIHQLCTSLVIITNGPVQIRSLDYIHTYFPWYVCTGLIYVLKPNTLFFDEFPLTCAHLSNADQYNHYRGLCMLK